ncbi:uncharacterized protein LOC123721191 [Papilio machaon]|uniref:uncharacterized protein LOC123721191 n=1 Tax=Papilio machaon TaxID=76193 RepID=UPI001E665644|nr:uncharacterized protein LOC123721191 [Papilio machaon]
MEHARPPAELILQGGPAARADAWRKWYKQFQVFLKASGVHKSTKDVQSSLLVNLIGPEGYDVYTTFKFTKDEDAEDIEILVKKFNEHFGSKQNTTITRFKFFTRSQNRGESIDEYVTALKLLSQSCEFEHLEDGLIRDRIVCGVADGVVRERLLRTEDLTLAKAVKICQANEMSNEETQQIEETKGGSAEPEPGASGLAVDAVAGAWGNGRRGRGRGGQQRPLPAARRRSEVSPRFYKKVMQLNESYESDSDKDLYHVSTLREKCKDNKYGGKWYEYLILNCNGNRELFKLDTGSDLNVISIDTFKRLGCDFAILYSDNTRAQSFCGNYLTVVGACDLSWTYKSRTYNLHFIVTKHNCQSVLGKNACEELGMIRRIHTIDITSYDDLFKGLGKLPGKYKIVIDESVQPSICPVRKIPIGVRQKLLVELNRMTELGVIRKVSHPTEWVNAIVVAAKKDGGIRVCLDPRPLNKAVRRAHYPLPTLAEIACRLQGATVFSKLDARSGFWMCEIDDASADLCTFGTPFGRYQFLRLPYGINCAPEVFHSKIRQILEDLEGVDSFVDDIVVWGVNIEEHDRRLKALLDRAREVGHTFSASGMQIDKSKLRAITDMPPPKDRPSLERFLGMVNYLSKYIPNYSEEVYPLRCLLKKDSVWCWDRVQEAAVTRVKRLLSGAPVLALYETRAPVLVSVDASARALGAVLLQRGRPVEFASMTLNDTQCRYAQIEKELLAIVFALERFHQYVFGRSDVTVETDHKPLESLFKKSLDSVPARLQRMMLRAQAYDFKVVYKPGKYMYIADTLSRAPLGEILSDNISNEVEEQTCFLLENVRFSSEKTKLVKEFTAKDEECQLLISYIGNGWPDNKYEVDERVRAQWSYRELFEYVDGIIFKDNLVYIPRGLRKEMIDRVHDGHMGIDRCKRHAREVMFWPGMSRDVEQRVRRCAACTERAPRPPREPLLFHHIPDIPWVKVGSDIFQIGKNYYLILVDYFSNFVEVVMLTNICSRSVIGALKEQFARHGIPAHLVTDNGPAYASKEFASFCRTWGFDHITTSPHYPQSNGRSERTVRTVKEMLKKSYLSGTDFYLGLLNFRATPRDGIASPSEYDWHSRALPELQAGQEVIIADGVSRRRRGRVQARAAQPRSYFVSDAAGRCYRRNRRHLINIGQQGSAYGATEPTESGCIPGTSSADSALQRDLGPIMIFFHSERRILVQGIGQDLSLPAVVVAALAGKLQWSALVAFYEVVMLQKENVECERERERTPLGDVKGEAFLLGALVCQPRSSRQKKVLL